MNRVFLTSTMRQPFVLADERLLRKHFNVTTFIGNGLVAVVRVFLGAVRNDVCISWFGSVYSWAMVLGAKLGGTKSVIIVGGVDAAARDDLDYGIWRTPWKASLLRQVYRRADLVLPVDPSLLEVIEQQCGFPIPSSEILPTGYDSEFWTPGPNTDRSGVLTVATVDSRNRALVKGIDRVIAAAQALPDTTFTLIGVDASALSQFGFDTPPNLTAIGPADRVGLLNRYRSASVLLQPSRSEGLPNVVCEAMLCGVVPVATDVGGSATAVGDTGFLVPEESPTALTRAIESAMGAEDSKRQQCRQRVVDRFAEDRRETRLVELIERLAKGKRRS